MQFISKAQFKEFIKAFDFPKLFNQLGWNYLKENHPIKIKEETYSLESVAEKSGFRIIVCSPGKDGNVPDYAIRLKIDAYITKLFREHLIIFIDRNKHSQLWQLILREPGQPAKLTETRWDVKKDPELLFQRTSSLFFTLDEEEKITIIDVKTRVNENFHQNTEKVTKKFYEGFKKEHISFISFIKGIGDKVNTDWYASLMMNRLMFCYFIQKKGFLDQDINYLKKKLKNCQEKKGKNKFYSFYKDFLRALFHQGLGSPDHSPELRKEIGTVPYLNGGLFDEHELERNFPKIDIDDKAFERLFDFFDQYEWHLDTRMDASGKDINPDVIGYIFEKYINDRAKMGAYYTKEDITEYISKNCIIPYLFDEMERNYQQAFKPDAEIWSKIKDSEDLYVYPAVKHGLELQLPAEIEKGIKEISKREKWNNPAPSDFGLPTEIWREVVDRRNRYNEVREKINSGSITCINDFITYNLDIRQFLQDVLKDTSDPKIIAGFYKSLQDVTILDPTCGSGAFLFAAMNILEPLYETCLMRMRAFVEDEDRLNTEDKKHFKNQYKLFRDILANLENPQHPNRTYFIYKTIILNNLYGVDLMKEATEIAKLRLFLKLVATVDADYDKENLGLEPLPDVDFNIRSGNTLVGFATLNEAENAIQERDKHKNKHNQVTMGLVFDEELSVVNAVKEKAEQIAMAYDRFKDDQLIAKDQMDDKRNAKKALNERIHDLNEALNIYLAYLYGINDLEKKIDIEIIDEETNKKKSKKINEYQHFLASHHPFHWFAEFYDIIQTKAGFKIVIGNPPYVEYTKVKNQYTLSENITTIKCSNLYAYVIEISQKLLNSAGVSGFIIPLSGFCTQRMEPLVNLLMNSNNNSWVSHYGWRPATLFEGVNIPLSIIISKPAFKGSKSLFVTEFYKWYREKRKVIMELIDYNNSNELLLHPFVIPKIGRTYNSVLTKILAQNKNISSYLVPKSPHILYYRNTGGLYWRIITDFKPFFRLNGNEATSSTLNYICFKDNESLLIALSLFNSNLFWLYYVAYSSFHHVNPIDLTSLPIEIESIAPESKKNLISLARKIMTDMKMKSTVEMRIHKGGNKSEAQTFYPSLSKEIVDRVDLELARHYGFNIKEVDDIINYDIQFRLQAEQEEITNL